MNWSDWVLYGLSALWPMALVVVVSLVAVATRPGADP